MEKRAEVEIGVHSDGTSRWTHPWLMELEGQWKGGWLLGWSKDGSMGKG